MIVQSGNVASTPGFRPGRDRLIPGVKQTRKNNWARPDDDPARQVGQSVQKLGANQANPGADRAETPEGFFRVFAVRRFRDKWL